MQPVQDTASSPMLLADAFRIETLTSAALAAAAPTIAIAAVRKRDFRIFRMPRILVRGELFAPITSKTREIIAPKNG